MVYLGTADIVVLWDLVVVNQDTVDIAGYPDIAGTAALVVGVEHLALAAHRDGVALPDSPVHQDILVTVVLKDQLVIQELPDSLVIVEPLDIVELQDIAATLARKATQEPLGSPGGLEYQDIPVHQDFPAQAAPLVPLVILVQLARAVFLDIVVIAVLAAILGLVVLKETQVHPDSRDGVACQVGQELVVFLATPV
jgi:hypothetical protein